MQLTGCMAELSLYDVIGRDYTTTRAADPRIAGAIWSALGDARSALNVGAVRAGSSIFARLPETEVAHAMKRLRDDLASGFWHAHQGHLLTLSELDLGYYLVIADFRSGRQRAVREAWIHA